MLIKKGKMKRKLKFKESMMLIYIFGVFIPMICMCTYFAINIYKMLLQEVYQLEKAEMNVRWTSLLDTFKDLESVSRKFYSDEKLQKIAETDYSNNPDEVINDYTNYQNFTNYKNDYSGKIDDFRIYMENPTLQQNHNFNYAKNVENEEWYNETLGKKGAVVWSYNYDEIKRFKYLCLTRLIKTDDKKKIGVLLISVSNQKIKDMLQSEDEIDVFLVINDEQVISADEQNFLENNALSKDNSEVCKLVKENKKETTYSNVMFKGERCLMTVLETEPEYEGTSFTLVSFHKYGAVYKNIVPKIVESVWIIMLGITVSMCCLICFLKWFGGKVFLFKSQMEKVSKGDYNIAEEIGGSYEIGELYDYLLGMIGSIQKLTSEVYKEKMQKEQLYSRQKDIEFKMLASQINPHFLYNTLELIRMKARNNKEYEIEELVRSLAKIMRKNIEVGNEMVTIKSELTIVKYYLHIQKCRFGDRIQYNMECDEEAENLFILPLVLQPIVENAVVHGLEEKENGGCVHIKVQKTLTKIALIVEDNGCGISKDKLEEIKANMNNYDDMNKTHIGVANVNQRIKLFYGKMYGLKVKTKENIGTKIIMILPIKLPKDI